MFDDNSFYISKVRIQEAKSESLREYSIRTSECGPNSTLRISLAQQSRAPRKRSFSINPSADLPRRRWRRCPKSSWGWRSLSSGNPAESWNMSELRYRLGELMDDQETESAQPPRTRRAIALQQQITQLKKNKKKKADLVAQTVLTLPVAATVSLWFR